jgi:integrase
MMGLKWSAVDLEGGSIHIRRTLVRDDDGWYLREPKTKTSVRSIPISAGTVEILKAHKKQQAELRMKHARHWSNHGFVFPDVFGGPLELRVFRRRHFKAVLKATADELHPPDEAKVDEDVMRQRESLLTTRLYDLRHTCATLMIKAGLNPKDVSERLGHKSVAFTLDTYVWPDEDSQRDATDRLEKLIEGNES